MTIDIRSLALASGSVAAALFALCSLFVVLAPQATLWATEQLFHLSAGAPLTLTWGGFVAGLAFWFVAIAALAGGLAALYQRWARA